MNRQSNKTFAELGIPFPLFEAPVSEATEYEGLGTCELCGATKSHCFRIGIGDSITRPCPSCRSLVGHHVADQSEARCPSCNTVASWPSGLGTQIRACYACIRAGRGLMGKDTEFGMLGWDQRVAGVTHGVPGLGERQLAYPEIELVQTGEPCMEFGEMQPAWFGAKLPTSVMDELLRTPTFSTWQGETWLFDGAQPMVYVGAWGPAQFDAHADDGDGRGLFLRTVEGANEGTWDGFVRGSVTVYMFRSPRDGHVRGGWDMD